MSTIQTIYDNLISEIESALSSYTRIPNPYEPNENPSLFLRKGFGCGISSGQNSFRQICNKVSVSRYFNVVLTNEVMTTTMNSAARGEFERGLMNDQYVLINALDDSNLSGTAIKVQYTSDNGIEYVKGDTEKYIFIETIFEIEYFETIT
jgi:hypothetical protein